ncbi:MAG TPA: zinc-ribbon domain-containing protein, partial [Actinomycetota bacterium]|nr:zinc-ribbon domain-containing protein [Actinomycetota bacterium]
RATERVTCSSCGEANPAGSRFCSNCGTRLDPSLGEPPG